MTGPSAPDHPVIEARDLRKEYRLGAVTVPVFSGLSLTVSRGEILCIVGPSGVGKTTLLNLLGTLDRPTGGELRLGGEDVTRLPDRALATLRNRRIGFVFQFHHLLPEFTALENTMMPGLIAGFPPAEVQLRALDLLRRVGLEHRLYHKPNELSGGEQQRVAVARALANAPDLLLADEPTGNLDRTNAEALQDLLWELCKGRGQTTVLVTHNERLAAAAHRVVELTEQGLRPVSAT